MKPILEPEEALAGPLYLVALLLVVIPVADLLLSVPAVNVSSVQWRFSAMGLLSGHTLMTILGLSLALVMSGILKHHRVQRALVIICLTTGVALAVLSVSFLLDALRLRVSVPPDGQPAFNSAWHRAVIRLLLSAVALMYLGWGARRMIPAGTRHRGPKPVHVVSK